MDSEEDLWFALTSGIFLDRNSRKEPAFMGQNISELWREDALPTLSSLLSEWEQRGGVNGTDKVDMPPEVISNLTGFMLALEMHLVGSRRDIEPLVLAAGGSVIRVQGLLANIRGIISR
jgi:hypothetical protein